MIGIEATMSASMSGVVFYGLRDNPDLGLSRVEVGFPSGLALSDCSGGKIVIDNSCDPQVYRGGEYYG